MSENELYEFAKDKKIKVKTVNLSDNIKGICLNSGYKSNIYIHSCLNNKDIERKCVLAEEIGHSMVGIISTSLNDTSQQGYLIRSINEFRAKKWAVNNLIPLSTFKQLIGTSLNKYEVAEKLEVTEELIDLACYIYEPYI